MPLINVCQFLSNHYEIKSAISVHVEAMLSKISGILNNAGVWKDLLVMGTAQLTVHRTNQNAHWPCTNYVIDWLVFQYFDFLIFFIY